MAKIPESRHMTVLSTKHFFGQRLAAVVACALLLGVLLTVGCDQTTTQARTSGTHTVATPTATLQPAPLSWESVNLPPGNLLPGLNNNLGELSVAPNDGTTAYACAAPVSLSAGATIWVTHDRGQHWRQLAPLPVVAQQLTYCWIVPDAVNLNIAVAELSWAPMKNLGEPAFMQGTHFVTFNSGAHWQPLRGPTRFDVRWMATYHGTTIAAVEAAVPGLAALWISHDQMQTWQSGAMLTGWDGLSINPATGELLHVGLFGVASESPHQLEESEDSGQHWTTISTPLDFTAIVSPAVAGQPWRICGTRYGSPQTDILMCSMDGGKTWTQRPQYDVTVTNPSNQQYQESATEVAVGPDGTVYATIGAIPPAALYRLVPGSDRWQSLGPVPQGQNAATAELPGAGIFWFTTAPSLPLYNP